MSSLKTAFKNEIRPDEYMGRVWLTATVVGIVLAGMAAFQNGEINLNYVLPMGNWQPRTPAGLLYLEVWATILVNAYQVAFGLWGAFLMCIGIKRIVTGNKYVFGCFFPGIIFLGIALALPSCVQPLLQLLVDKFPALVQ